MPKTSLVHYKKKMTGEDSLQMWSVCNNEQLSYCLCIKSSFRDTECGATTKTKACLILCGCNIRSNAKEVYSSSVKCYTCESWDRSYPQICHKHFKILRITWISRLEFPFKGKLCNFGWMAATAASIGSHGIILNAKLLSISLELSVECRVSKLCCTANSPNVC